MKILRPRSRAILLAALIISAVIYCLTLAQDLSVWSKVPSFRTSSKRMEKMKIMLSRTSERPTLVTKSILPEIDADLEKNVSVQVDESLINPTTHTMSPLTSTSSQFVPSRRIVHLDLKGAPPRVQYFKQFFRLLRGLGATGVLIEWEDMFPYSGILQDCKNGNAYAIKDVKRILRWAKENELEVIPLVQTFGHLEWVLKHEKFAHLREVEMYPQTICISNPDAISLVKTIIDQVASVHNSEIFHIGSDEAFQIGECDRCQNRTREKFDGDRDRLAIQHIVDTANYVRQKYKRRVLAWYDMLYQVGPETLNQTGIGELVEPIVWAYSSNVMMKSGGPEMWTNLSRVFPIVWGASAYKGANRPNSIHIDTYLYTRIHESWTEVMNDEYFNFNEFAGIILTGWQRYDHFAVLCELLPVGIPSLALGLQIIQLGGQVNDIILNKTGRILNCENSTEEKSVSDFGERCQFPGNKIYEIITEFNTIRWKVRNAFNWNWVIGWMNPFNRRNNYSSNLYVGMVLQEINGLLAEYDSVTKSLMEALQEVYYQETVDEFFIEHVDGDLKKLRDLRDEAERLGQFRAFPMSPVRIKRDILAES